MELLTYFITKPIILLLEIIFMIFGRIYGTNAVVLLVCVTANILLSPLYYAAASGLNEPFPKTKKTEK